MGAAMRGIYLDDTNVYAAEQTGVKQSPKTASLSDNASNTSYVGPTPQNNVGSYGVVSDADSVFFTNFHTFFGPTLYGSIQKSARVTLGGSGANTLYVGNYENPFNPHPFHEACGLVADADNLYLMTDNGIILAPKVPTGTIGSGMSNDYTQLAYTGYGCLNGVDSSYTIAIDDSNIYYIDAPGTGVDRVMKIAKTGGSAIELVTGQTWLASLAVSNGEVFFTAQGSQNPGSVGVVGKVGINGGEISLLATSQPNPYGIAVDGSNVYFTRKGSCADTDGDVQKMSRDGATIATLDMGLRCPRSIAVDDSNAFWVATSPIQPEYDGVFRLAK